MTGQRGRFTVGSYGTIAVSVILLTVTLIMLNVVPNLIASRDTFVDTSVLISMNPVFAAAFSENILVQDQSLSSTSQPFGLQSITLPSPWIPFVVTYPLLSVLMILARIYFVGKPDQ